MRKRIRTGLLVFIILIIPLYFFLILGLPASFSIVEGTESRLLSRLPFTIYLDMEDPGCLVISGENQGVHGLSSGQPLRVRGKSVGSTSIEFKLFGIIPLKTINVNILPDVSVYPGGQAVGVLLRSRGVMVVGSSYVEVDDGKRVYPARKAGIKVGDSILEINGNEINDKVKLSSLIQEFSEKNRDLNLKIKDKNGSVKEVVVTAVRDKNDLYMIGIYVDDGVAGVGTLTFYEPSHSEYGALGHQIIETNSNTGIEVREGRIVQARISGISYGRKGMPGEKLGTYFHYDQEIGNIVKNNKYGIFGKIHGDINNPFFEKPIPVAAISEIEEAPAQIYTVVNGDEVEEFEIHIDQIKRQSYPDDKGLVISITDPQLKRITGGIIQGMSGSPIVQNGKLVGAITHVFVNNPVRGYGVFAEWMLLQTNIYDTLARAN